MMDVKQVESEQAPLLALLQGQVADAARLIAQAKWEQGESSSSQHRRDSDPQGLPAVLVENASYLLTLPYDDLPYAAEVRRYVAAQLALGVLLWERPEVIALRLLRLTDGKFSCPSLETFLRSNPPGKLWFYFNPNRPQDQAALYAQTRCIEAAAAVRLKRLLEEKSAGQRLLGYQGIAIRYSGGHECSTCLRSKRHYSWAELEDLPKLPRHWGCHCMYIPWECDPERP